MAVSFKSLKEKRMKLGKKRIGIIKEKVPNYTTLKSQRKAEPS